MAEAFEYRSSGQGPGDGYRTTDAVAIRKAHDLDGDEARKEFRQLLQWYFYERDRQAQNRLEMAVDHDFYDSIQWDQEDAAMLNDRGQVPLVYNEVAPMADWIIGTERRNRVDWRVLPRTEDDVEMADVKTKTLKYVSDINRVPFARSRGFADSIKGGIGWVDDGARDDPTQDVLYSRYEDWRNVIWDSSAQELDLSDARYLFRWRWVDEDVACMMFPDREAAIKRAVDHWDADTDPEADEDTATSSFDSGAQLTGRSGTYRGLSSGYFGDTQRRRVKLIEAQYRKPMRTKIVADGPLKGSYFDPRDTVMADAIARQRCGVIDKIAMRVHVAVFTEADLVAMGPSIYRHNRFSLTPIWCYRRGRDRQPYGVIRRVRDIQRDLNKRASKALWLMNTNQVIAEEGAVEDIEIAREEAQAPDGWIAVKAGKKLEIRRDTDAATGQLQMMAMDAQSIQKSGGVNNENLGRQTNAVSGEAIRARQLQGAVATTEPFDNLRLAVQAQGEKQLSLVEQFYSEEKVIRLTGAKGAIEWVRINIPELQADGTYRYLNDITASTADFVVSEQDYAGTLRQVMFDAMNQIAAKLPDPGMALRFLTIAFEFSDLPNKDEIADQLRKLTGDRDSSKPMTPEEEQQAQAQAAMQEEAMQMQREQAKLLLEEQRAKVRELHAKADALVATAAGAAAGEPGTDPQEMQRMVEDAVRPVQEQAAQQIDKLTQQLAKVQADQSHKVLAVKADADAKTEIARIQADATVQAAEVTAASNKQLDALLKRIEAVATKVESLGKDTARDIEDVKQLATEASKAAEKAAEPAPVAAPVAPAPAVAAPVPPPPPPAPAGPAPQPVVLMVQQAPVAPTAAAGGTRKVKVAYRYDKAGDLAGATVQRADGSTEDITIERGSAGKDSK